MTKWILLMLVAPALVLAGEYCAQDYRGICRTDCLMGETPANGGFIDCDDKQVCCIKAPAQDKEDSESSTGEQGRQIEEGKMIR